MNCQVGGTKNYFGASKEKVMLENEAHKLSAMLEEAKAKILEQDKEIVKLKEIRIKKRKTNTEMQKNLQSVYNGVLSLSKIINGLIKGDEPNMSVLLGDTKKDKDSDKELTEEEVAELNDALESIRRSICDYYAEKYSNECIIN